MLGVVGALTFLLVVAAPCAAGVVTTRVGTCDVRLERRQTEPVLLFRPGCPLTADATRTALAALLADLFPDRRWPPDVQSISMGRIETLPWLSARLAIAAARDPGWDARTGRPRAGGENAFAMRLLDRGRLWADVAEVLAGWGVAVRTSGVEKVLVGPAGTLAIAEELRAAGVPAEARVPFDAQLWLRVVGR